MIVGVGVDIVENRDFRERSGPELIAEIFLPNEIAYAQARYRSWESFAARLAAKEAAFKALGAGLADGLRWHDVEVVRAESGAVELRLTGRAAEIAQARGVRRTHLSISHSQELSLAVVVAEA